jgi:hypothetical protein
VTPLILSVPTERTSPQVARALATGTGGRVLEVPPLAPVGEPIAFFASPVMWPMLVEAQAKRIDFYYGDKGYFKRDAYIRLTRNAYQHDGRGEASPDRFRRFDLPIRPWRTTGRHIVVCPNSPAYFRLFGLNADDWLQDVQDQLARTTDREVHIRWKSDVRVRPLEADLVDAWAVVVFSSNAAVDALLAGVPVFVLAPFCAAARMGLSTLASIEVPFYPDDRESFAWNLAAHQWTLEEIARGEAWHALHDAEAVAA